MVSIPMTPEQFEKAQEIVAKDHPEAKIESTGENVGHIHTSQVDADYVYHPEANGGTLVFENEVKHGLYNMVSDDTIGAHLGKLLAALPKAEPELAKVPVAETEKSGAEPVVENEVPEQETPSDAPVDGQVVATTPSFVKPTL